MLKTTISVRMEFGVHATTPRDLYEPSYRSLSSELSPTLDRTPPSLHSCWTYHRVVPHVSSLVSVNMILRMFRFGAVSHQVSLSCQAYTSRNVQHGSVGAACSLFSAHLGSRWAMTGANHFGDIEHTNMAYLQLAAQAQKLIRRQDPRTSCHMIQ